MSMESIHYKNVRTVLAAAVNAGLTFDVPYPSGMSAADFQANQGAVTVHFRGVDYAGNAVAFDTPDASHFQVTWDAGQPVSVPAGETVEVVLDLVRGDETPVGVKKDLNGVIGNLAAGSTADQLLAALKASGLMQPD